MLIAQISDIHVTPDLSSLQTLERAIDWLKTFRPDALVVTGDLVDDGWRQGYRLIAECLRSLDCPVHLLPGNGDDAFLMRSELAAVGTWAAAAGPMHFRAAVIRIPRSGRFEAHAHCHRASYLRPDAGR